MRLHLLSGLSLLSALFCLGLAIFVISRNPKHKVNLSFALGMTALSVVEFGHFMSFASSLAVSGLFWKKVSLAGEVLLPGPWLMFSLTFGRSNLSRHLIRWRYGMMAVYLLTLGFMVALGSGWFLAEDFTLKRGGYWFSVFLLLMLTLVLANFEMTLRSAGLEQRWRFKFLILGLGSIFAVMIYILSQALLYSSVARDFSPMLSTVILVGCGLVAFSLVRYRLLDVDVFVSRYVVYNSVTLAAVGLYLLIVGGAVQAIKSLDGDFNLYLGSLFVFAAVLLMAVLLLSYNVRKRVKVFIDRNFFKYKYDYRKEWLELTDRLSSKLNVQELFPPLANLIFETFWIKRTILWLYDEQEREFRIVQPADDPISRSMKWEPGLIQLLKDRDYPLVLSELPYEAGRKADPESSGVLDDRQKAVFQSLGVSILVPLVVEKQLIGMLGLSGSHSAAPLNYEDYDLMKTMAKQAASSLLNAKLMQRLVSSKELETFHSFSIFLLHDLKNFVSMISLVVENMNQNFDNPEFRKDALVSLTLTADKMKRLMERLAALSRTPAPSSVSADLNAIVHEALIETGKCMKSRIVRNTGELPVIPADPAQIKKVVTNLLLNAEEAITGEGEIRLTTAVQGGMVTLSVSDNGCGMSREFLENRLFKPFSTTKSQGFGIGLYQIKSILDAHGGRIQVSSEAGKGSTFTVTLPIESRN